MNMAEQIDEGRDFSFRLNRKQNFKGERGWEYTVRADDVEDLKVKDKQALTQAIKNDLQITEGE